MEKASSSAASSTKIVDYELERPSYQGILTSICRVMGEPLGHEVWTRACASAGPSPGAVDDPGYFLRTLELMAQEDGLAQVVARSNIIRMHTWLVLAASAKRHRA